MDKCIEWKPGTPKGWGKQLGYYMFKMEGVQYYVHRFAWEVFNGPIPEGMQVCHTCDNPACVNPKHLVLATAKQNTHDMIAKGRHPRMYYDPQIHKKLEV